MNRTTLLIAVVSLALFVEAVAYGLIVPIIPSYAYGLGASDLELGIIFAMYPAVQIVAMMPVGILSDRYGRRWFIIVGLAALALCTLAFALSTKTWELILTRGLQGLAASCIITAGLAIISKRAASGHMGGSLGIATATQGGGLVFGPVMGGLLLEWGGYAVPFLVTMALALAIAVWAFFALRDVDGPRRVNVAPAGGLAWSKVLGDRTVLATILVIVVWGVGFGFLEPAYSTYLGDRFAADAAMVGAFFTAVSIPYAFSQPFFGKLSDRIGRKKLVVTSALLFAALFSLLTVPDDFIATTAVGALLGLSQGMLFATSLPLLIDALARIRKGTEGAATGLYNSAFAVGLAAGPLAFGVYIGPVGLTGLSVIYSALATSTAVAALALIAEPKRAR